MTFSFGTRFSFTITATQVKALTGLVVAIGAVLQAFGVVHVVPMP